MINAIVAVAFLVVVPAALMFLTGCRLRGFGVMGGLRVVEAGD